KWETMSLTGTTRSSSSLAAARVEGSFPSVMVHGHGGCDSRVELECYSRLRRLYAVRCRVECPGGGRSSDDDSSSQASSLRRYNQWIEDRPCRGQSQQYCAAVRFELVSNTGLVVMSTTREIGPSEHMAVYLEQLFGSLPPMVGRLQFGSTNPLTSVALRFSPGGASFTTLAPLAIGN